MCDFMEKKVGIKESIVDKAGKKAKKGFNRGKGRGFEQAWTDEKRKKLIEELLVVANDEDEKEYTLKQICYRAGYSYEAIEELKKVYDDVATIWSTMKSILQRRWLALAIENKGNAKVVSQFLNHHSKEVLDDEDKRELEKTKRIEKVKTDEKIRSQKAFVNDNEEVIINIVSSTAQAIQDINSKNKKALS